MESYCFSTIIFDSQNIVEDVLTKDYEIGSYTTYVMCGFRTTDFCKAFLVNFIYSQNFCQKKSPKK